MVNGRMLRVVSDQICKGNPVAPINLINICNTKSRHEIVFMYIIYMRPRNNQQPTNPTPLTDRQGYYVPNLETQCKDIILKLSDTFNLE